jgi:subtilisin family serine protease
MPMTTAERAQRARESRRPISHDKLSPAERAKRAREAPPRISDDEFSRDDCVLRHVRAPAAWSRVSAGARPIVVGVVDSGVADNHEDLLSALTARTEIRGETRDDEDHGTAVAGTVGAARGNQLGIAGAAKVLIAPVKFCSAQFLPNANRGARAIKQAYDAGADVILLAWDCGYNTDELADAIDSVKHQSVVVVAAGNHALDNNEYPNWPANYGDGPHVITVMAIDENDERASFSNYGNNTVHLAAPGFSTVSNIWSTVPYSAPRNPGASYTRGYRSYRGTSVSAALVAGLVALVRGQYPTWNPDEVKSHVLDTARRERALETFCAGGRIADFDAALV